MDPRDRARLVAGIAAAAVLIAVVAIAVAPRRGGLPPRVPAVPASRSVAAPSAVERAETAAQVRADQLAAENAALRGEVARLRGERDAALARLAPAARPLVTARPPAARPAHPRAPASGAFSEPQSFGTLSTSPQR